MRESKLNTTKALTQLGLILLPPSARTQKHNVRISGIDLCVGEQAEPSAFCPFWGWGGSASSVCSEHPVNSPGDPTLPKGALSTFFHYSFGKTLATLFLSFPIHKARRLDDHGLWKSLPVLKFRNKNEEEDTESKHLALLTCIISVNPHSTSAP